VPNVTPEAFIDALHHLERTRDVEPMAALYLDDADISNPLVRYAHRGPDGARRFWSAYRAAFGEIRSEFHHVVADGSAALLEWTSTGTSPGGEIRYRGVSVLEFGDGGVAAFRTYFDPRHLGDQLVEHPAAPGKSAEGA
jgi:limonene-1,2-epoxide hydrolase